MKTLLLFWTLLVSAGADRDITFDFGQQDRRYAIELEGKANSDKRNVEVRWKQIQGPKGFITEPAQAATWFVVDEPGIYELWFVASDGAMILSDTVKFIVKSGKGKQ